MITISNKALARINAIRKNENLDNSVPLRIGVVGGGCSGLTYKLDFDKDNTVQDASEKVFEIEGTKLIVDMRSYLYLAGTELDFSEGLDGKGFHFRNPNATRTCSCGESFSV